MLINLKKRDLNAININDVIDIICLIDVIKFIDVIEKLIENVIKQMICVFVIKINKFDNDVDIDIDLNIIDKINKLNEKNDVIDILI